MQDAYGSTNTSGFARAMRYILPWALFGVLVWVIVGYGTQFMREAKTVAGAQGSAAQSSTASAASVLTTVTGMVATVRVDLSLRSQPATGTPIVATSRRGSTLQVLAKQGTWFRVRDKYGYVGWVPNDSAYIALKPATAPKSSTKKKK
jgi:SH3-like domain-containing protein